MPETANAGLVFSNFIEKELQAERERRAAMDARGIAVVTTSGTLVSLIFALGALVTGLHRFKPSEGTVWALVVALTAFIVAAGCGLAANRLVYYDVVDTDQLSRWRQADSQWGDSDDKARRVLALVNIRTIDSLRRGSDKKADWIERALVAQLLAIAALSFGVSFALFDAL